MSEDGNQLGAGGPGTGLGGNQLGGSLPSPSSNGNQIDAPGIGKINRGPTDLHTQHAYNKALYNKLVDADRMLGHIRNEMDKLVTLGDAVTPDDVIGAAGRVVGHGVPAREMATILADMPLSAGQGLAAWIAQNDMLVAQQEGQVAQTMRIAGHHMAVSGMRVLAANAVQDHARRIAAPAGQLMTRRTGALQTPTGTPQLAQPQVMQVAQRPSEEGPGAEEAV